MGLRAIVRLAEPTERGGGWARAYANLNRRSGGFFCTCLGQTFVNSCRSNGQLYLGTCLSVSLRLLSLHLLSLKPRILGCNLIFHPQNHPLISATLFSSERDLSAILPQAYLVNPLPSKSSEAIKPHRPSNNASTTIKPLSPALNDPVGRSSLSHQDRWLITIIPDLRSRGQQMHGSGRSTLKTL